MLWSGTTVTCHNRSVILKHTDSNGLFKDSCLYNDFLLSSKWHYWVGYSNAIESTFILGVHKSPQ